MDSWYVLSLWPSVNTSSGQFYKSEWGSTNHSGIELYFFCSRLSPCPFIALSFSIGLASCSASKFDFSLPMLWQLDVNARDCGALLGDGPNFLLCRSSSSDYFFIYFYLNGSPLLLLHLMTPDRSVDLLCCSRSSCLSVKIFPPKKKAGAVSHSLGRH